MQMLDYNVPGGKLNRGMAVLDVLRALKGEGQVPCATPPHSLLPIRSVCGLYA